ncbi:MAG TPA: hypothetical protein VMJ35_09425 [Dongiaceae bacterium]|nr:hypothetical protein [Dongiaceae bacterium]
MQSKNWFWPDVSTLEGAKEAARIGMWYAVFVAGVTTLFVLLAIFGVSLMGTKPAALVDALLFVGVAYGLFRNSRFAAVAGLVLFVFEKVYMLVKTGSVLSVGVLGVIITLGFVNSVRGTFAYAKLAGGTSSSDLSGFFRRGDEPSPGARPLQM